MREGRLWSPQQHTLWPPNERLVAACRYRAIEWQLREPPAGWEEELFWVPSSVLRAGESTQVGWPPEKPPEGMTWVPVEAKHDLSKCKGPCGIYVVSTPEQCESYLRMTTRGRVVLVLVALWGQVVVAERGGRGEFGYPVRIVGPEEWAEEIEEVAAAYGVEWSAVPVELTDDAEFARLLLGRS